jgi:hypothetical protein
MMEDGEWRVEDGECPVAQLCSNCSSGSRSSVHLLETLTVFEQFLTYFCGIIMAQHRGRQSPWILGEGVLSADWQRPSFLYFSSSR